MKRLRPGEPPTTLVRDVITYYTPVISKSGVTWRANTAPGYICAMCREPHIREEATAYGDKLFCLDCEHALQEVSEPEESS